MNLMSQNSIELPNLRGQNILVTGGLGFIGSNLALKYLELGANVTIYDCLDPHSGGNMQNVRTFEKDIEIVLNDIRNFEGISQHIRKKDILVNCAAFTSHPLSMKEPLIDIDVNCKGVINLLEAARRFNPDCKFVHIGTSTQIGKMKQDVIDELHPEFPLDIYSASKSASEKYVMIYGHAYDMRTTVIRLANNFGPRSNIKNPDLGFMNYFIGLGLKQKTITVFGIGSQLKNISYVDDSVNALVLASQSEACNGEVVFAVSDTQFSVSDLAKTISATIGGGVQFVDWPKEREMIDIGDAIISNAKIKTLLNWEPVWNLKDGLIETKAYYESVLTEYLP
jgi:UDP-glucose 4-epimerase